MQCPPRDQIQRGTKHHDPPFTVRIEPPLFRDLTYIPSHDIDPRSSDLLDHLHLLRLEVGHCNRHGHVAAVAVVTEEPVPQCEERQLLVQGELRGLGELDGRDPVLGEGAAVGGAQAAFGRRRAFEDDEGERALDDLHDVDAALAEAPAEVREAGRERGLSRRAARNDCFPLVGSAEMADDGRRRPSAAQLRQQKERGRPTHLA